MLYFNIFVKILKKLVLCKIDVRMKVLNELLKTMKEI